MKIWACIKEVQDISAGVGSVRRVLNAYDASAIEAALCLKERLAATVGLMLIGPEGARDTIRKGLAMGADEARHLLVPENADLDSAAVASLLACALEKVSFDLIMCGKQSQDSDSGLVGGMLAGKLGLPYVSNAIDIGICGDGESNEPPVRDVQRPNSGLSLDIVRQTDRAAELYRMKLPGLVTCSNDMNEPRIPTLRGIMDAAVKPVDAVKAEQVASSRVRVIERFDPPERPSGAILTGEVAEMVGALVARLGLSGAGSGERRSPGIEE